MKPFYALLLMGLWLISCTPTPMDKVELERIEYSVLTWADAGFSDIEKFEKSIKDYTDFLFFIDKGLEFRVAAITYKTIDPNGEPVTASGLVLHPTNRKSKGTIEVLPTANLDKYGGGSDKLYAGEAIFVYLGYTIILPDLLGFGINKDGEHPFLMAENTGRVTYDLRRAAAQYLWKEFNYALPVETTIAGYSLGGSAALAVQKYYETVQANTVKVKRTLAGGGTYDLPAAFAEFAKTGLSEYPAIPSVIIAFNHYYELELDFSKIFKGELVANWQDWFDRTRGSGWLRNKVGSDLHAYMHEDFFKPFDQQNDEFKKLHPLLVENSVSEGWTPKAPITLTHALVDTYVPESCARTAAQKLRRAGGCVTLLEYPGDHFTVGYIYLAMTLIEFLL